MLSYTTGFIVVAAGETLTQAVTNATGVVAVASSQTGGSNVIYLEQVSAAFNTTNEFTGSVSGGLGAASVPVVVDSNGYDNPVQGLSMYVYDMKDPPSNRSEVNIWHPNRPAFARYEVANATVISHIVAEYPLLVETTDYSFTKANAAATGFIFNIYKTIDAGYTVTFTAENDGVDYTIGDEFVVTGDKLGGATTANDCTVTVATVDVTGQILTVTVAGTIAVEATTPKYSGAVYKLNFSTSDTQFSANGLLEIVPFNTSIVYYRNQTHIISDLARPDVLTIRPSTALTFDENPTAIYRTISFLTSDSIGNDLPANVAQGGLDASYDYIRLTVESSKATEVALQWDRYYKR